MGYIYKFELHIKYTINHSISQIEMQIICDFNKFPFNQRGFIIERSLYYNFSIFLFRMLQATLF